MLNKLKRAVKYIVKKVKQGVKIMAKTTSKVVDNAVEVVSNELEIKKEVIFLIRDAGKTVYSDSKKVVKTFCIGSKNTVTNVFSSLNNSKYKMVIGLGLFAIGFIDEMNNRKEVK